MSNIIIINGVNITEKLERQEKLLELYRELILFKNNKMKYLEKPPYVGSLREIELKELNESIDLLENEIKELEE